MPDFSMSLRTTWWGHLDEVQERLRMRLLLDLYKLLLEVPLRNFRQILMGKLSLNQSGSNTFVFELILKNVFKSNSEIPMLLLL